MRRHHTLASATSATAQGDRFSTRNKIIFSKHTHDQMLRRRNPHPCLLRQHYFPTLPCSARPPAGSCQGASGNQRLTLFIWLYSFDGETLEYAAINPGSILYRKQPLLFITVTQHYYCLHIYQIYTYFSGVFCGRVALRNVFGIVL